MNHRQWPLLMVFAGCCLPLLSQPVPFSFNFSNSGPVGAGPALPPGTCAPYGACQERFRSSAQGASGSFSMAGGSLDFTVSLACFESAAANCPLTATGGTGIFTGASGTGTYSDIITTSGGNFAETISGSIQLTLTGSQGVTLVPPSLQMQTPAGAIPSVGGIAINNGGSSAITFSAASSDGGPPDWLSVSPASGTVAAGSSGALVVRADPTGLQLGVYNGQINVTFNGGSQLIPVTFVVGGAGAALQLSLTGLTFQATIGGPSPATKAISVTNTGIGTLSGLTVATSVVGSGPNWLQASLSAGFASQSSATITVSVTPGSLPRGTYSGQLTLSMPGAVNSPQTVTVQLTVGTALPTVTPAVVYMDVPFDTYAGTLGTIPPPAVLTITNPSLVALNFTITTAATGVPPGWVNDPLFKLIATSGSIPAGGSTAITFTFDTTCFTGTQAATGEFCQHTFLDVFALNFPDITYTYYLNAHVILTGPSSAPPIPSWGSPPTGLPSPLTTGAGLERGQFTGAADVCTPSVLEGQLTSLPMNGVLAAIGEPIPLQVAAFDNCGNNLNSGSVFASFSTGDPPVALAPLGGGQWSATWVPGNAAAAGIMTLQGVSPSGLTGGGTLPIGVTTSTTPVVTPGGVTNAASNAAVVAPGAFIAIYGENMAPIATIESTATYPTSLNGTQVFLNGEAVPLYFTAGKQIDAIVPFDIAPGSTPQLVVQNGSLLSTPVNVPVGTASPGVFTQDQSGSGPGAILGLAPGGVPALNTASNPSKAGDALEIYCTGLGPVSPAVAAGTPASLTNLSHTVNTVTAKVGGKDAQVLFAGLAPGYVGLYQVNLIVPSGIAPSNSVPVVLSVAGSSSAQVTVALK